MFDYPFLLLCTECNRATDNLERSLAMCLMALLVPENRITVVVVRFWKHLLDILNLIIVKNVYSNCCSEMQVSSFINYILAVGQLQHNLYIFIVRHVLESCY